MLDEFVGQVEALGDKLSVLLVQLPPSLELNKDAAASFFTALAARTPVRIVCEPRHPSWFASAANALLETLGVARVAADPASNADAARPGGWPGLAYWRLHGSPIMYRSSYADRLDHFADQICAHAHARESWCIFDNTAASAALPDALKLRELTRQSRDER